MKAIIVAPVAGAWPAFAPPRPAQQYPNRTVTIIVPYPAGGPTDETARMVAQSCPESSSRT